jgi:GTP-binding protein HflX
MHDLKPPKEKVFLVVIAENERRGGWPVEEIEKEMAELVSASGGEVVGSLSCKVAVPSPSTFLGKGKVEEIALLCGNMAVDTIVINQDLKGSQQRNLEEELKHKTIDRTQLILDIFARRATSREGKMQVELAQLEYLMPRLVGKGIELSRLGGGIGTVGPGETKLEVDRRRIGDKIARLKSGLLDVASDRGLKRKKRREQAIPAVSLVGYTNAGKSTLLNTLTRADQVTKDGLFTTLDSLSRQLLLPNHQKIIVSDTVGFIHQLPHHLVESFKATLEEVTDADLLLHVLDVSHPHFRLLYEAVNQVLSELNVAEKPIITVLNKIDKVKDAPALRDMRRNFHNSVAISALTGDNIDELLKMISEQLTSFVEIDVMVPISRMDLISLVHEKGEVFSIKYYNDQINIRASIPSYLFEKFNVWM